MEKCERRLLELLEKESLRQKLQKLDHALLRLCQIELQVEQLRDARMVLVEVRQLYQKLDSLDRKMNWRVYMHDYFSHLDINKIPLVHTIYNEVCDCIILDFCCCTRWIAILFAYSKNTINYFEVILSTV